LLGLQRRSGDAGMRLRSRRDRDLNDLGLIEVVEGRTEMRLMQKLWLATSLGLIALPALQAAGANPTPESFAKLKSMVGHWESQAKEGRSPLDIELTAGGSGILERSHETVEGKPVEMTTMYYLDGDKVLLTHYCMAGNQPTMRGTYSPETKTMT